MENNQEKTNFEKVIDVIKTFNVNLNEETMKELTKQVLPVYKKYLISEYVAMGLLFIWAMFATTVVLIVLL